MIHSRLVLAQSIAAAGLTIASPATACPANTFPTVPEAAQQFFADRTDSPAAQAQTAATINPQTIDPVAFFNALVERYHKLTGYRDSARLVQVTTRDGHEPLTVQTTIWCTIDGDELTIRTPASQVSEAVNLGGLLGKTRATRDLERQYELWLAPHMVLHSAENPLEKLREGVPDAFIPKGATAVQVGAKPLVHVELCTDGGSTDCRATVGLYVDPESMLVQRVESKQRLPDGAQYEATLEITPTLAESTAPRDGKIAPAEDPNQPGRSSPPIPDVPARTAARPATSKPSKSPAQPESPQPVPGGVRTATTPPSD